jgi:Ca2+:H+ antiporter
MYAFNPACILHADWPQDEIAIVQAALLGSILANLLLILGMCFLIGGLRFREQVRNPQHYCTPDILLISSVQIYNSTVTQMSACLLSLSVMSLLLPVIEPSNSHIFILTRM